MNKKKKTKNSKSNLISEEYYGLNIIFYREYNTNYFIEKTVIAMYLLNDTQVYKDKLEQMELEVGNIKFPKIIANNESIKKFAKTELMNTYYHCLETFIRLFIGHSTHNPCPWFEMYNLKTKEYREIIKKIAKNEFTFLNDKKDEIGIIISVFIGCTKLEQCKMSQEAFDKLRGWIVWCANELLTITEYNSMKHGLTMFQGFGGFSIKADGFELKKEGDAVNIIQSTIEDGKKTYNLKTTFADYDLKIAIIHLFSGLIENIIIVGKRKYIGAKGKYFDVPGMMAATLDFIELRQRFNKENTIAGAMSSYSKELLTEDIVLQTLKNEQK